MTRKLTHQRYEQLKKLGANFIEDYALCYPLEPLVIAEFRGVRVSIHHRGLPAVALFCDTIDGYTVCVQSRRGPKFHIHVSGLTGRLRQRSIEIDDHSVNSGTAAPCGTHGRNRPMGGGRQRSHRLWRCHRYASEPENNPC